MESILCVYFISDDDTATSNKLNAKNDSSSSDENDEDKDDDKNEDDIPTDDISGDEFIPEPKSSTEQALTKGLRVFAKWIDGHFYPGVIGNVSGEK